MLVSKAGLLAPTAFAGALAPASFAMWRMLCSRAAQAGASYAEFKAVANKTGDPAKEWVTGASADGAGVTRKLHLSPEVILESVKRGAEEATEVAMEACGARAMKELHENGTPGISPNGAHGLDNLKNQVPPNEGRTFPA